MDVIYLDFAKAFDKVPHQRLLSKIEACGIGERVWDWIKVWLSGRKQKVCINDQGSAWRLVTNGVLQGSVLGPVLFVMFINDLDKHVCSSVLKFADDTKLFSRVDICGDRDLLQTDLQYLLDWSDANAIQRFQVSRYASGQG